MYTVTEVAKMFSVSRQTVLKWINNGKIKAVKVVKVYRIPKEEIDRLLADREAEKGRRGEMKTCETCKHRGEPINTDKNMYWCECGKTCVNGSAWEKLDHPTEKGGD